MKRTTLVYIADIVSSRPADVDYMMELCNTLPESV